MSLLEQFKSPLRRVKTHLRELLFEHAGYYTKHNVTEAEIESSGEAFLINLCGRTWTRCPDVGANQGDYTVYRPGIERFDFSNWAAFSRKRFG